MTTDPVWVEAMRRMLRTTAARFTAWGALQRADLVAQGWVVILSFVREHPEQLPTPGFLAQRARWAMLDMLKKEREMHGLYKAHARRTARAKRRRPARCRDCGDFVRLRMQRCDACRILQGRQYRRLRRERVRAARRWWQRYAARAAA